MHAYLGAWLLSAAVTSAPVLAAEGGGVGTISFAIGVVKIIDSAGVERPAEAGGRIAVGDRIETAAGGHVHLKFIDNGLVSVRPGSQLVVEQYNTDASDTSIRFRLDRGVVRSITGDAAKVHKDRFRLNTPLAAIGVRGTDFVVKSDSLGMQAMVNQGAIVVASLGGGCVAQGLGPCSGGNAFELSDAMGRVLLEMSSVQPPRLAPRMAPFGGQPLDVPGAVPRDGGSQIQLAALADVSSADTAHHRLAGAPVVQPPVVQPPVVEPPVVIPQPPVVVPPVVEPVTPPVLPSGPALVQWGRWSSGAARDGDVLSVTNGEARDGRAITVADKYAGLYRTTADTSVLSTKLGQGTFALSGASVSLAQASGATSAGSVTGGWLKIDFAQRNFSTELSLNHLQTGAVQLSAAGKVRDDGLFLATPSNGRVAGAVSFDGTQAGYLFDRVVPQGTLTGITLWKR